MKKHIATPQKLIDRQDFLEKRIQTLTAFRDVTIAEKEKTDDKEQIAVLDEKIKELRASIEVAEDDKAAVLQEISKFGDVDMTEDEIAERVAEEVAAEHVALLRRIKGVRDEKIFGGMTINGISIKTDERTQTALTRARMKADRNNKYSANWKTEDGFMVLSADVIIALVDAVDEHVQRCFDAEEILLNDLDSIAPGDDLTAHFDDAYGRA